MKLKIILACISFTLISSFAHAGEWTADAGKAQIKFIIGGPFGKVNGSLSGLKATIVFDESKLSSSSVVASVDVNTIETGIDLRNKDLREKKDWFDAQKYPRISFHSKTIYKTANGYRVTGELIIKGTTKPVEISFTFIQTGNSGMLKGGFTINREDYGLGDSHTVGKNITISLEVPVRK